MRVHLPSRRRIDSSPAHGREVRISAVSELSVTGRKSSPSQRCSMWIVGRVAAFDLRGMEVQLAAVAIEIDQDLGRLGDGRRGVKTVEVAQQGKVGQRAVVVDVSGGEQEEIGQHPIAAPGFHQRRQAVEDRHAPRPAS